LHSASEEEPSRATRTDEDSDMEDARHDSDEDEEHPLMTEGSIRQCSVTSGTQPEIPQARGLSAVQDDSVTGKGVPKWLQR